MQDKLKAIFGSKVTWVSIGSVVGAVFGQHAAELVGALGSLVMVAI